MKYSGKQMKHQSPAMLPALQHDRYLAITPDIFGKHKTFNGCISIFQRVTPIVYYHEYSPARLSAHTHPSTVL